MSEFFNGWRRCTGCATLFLALIFMAGWVNSLAGRKSFPISSNEYGFTQLISFNGTIEWDWAHRTPIEFRDPMKVHNQIMSFLDREKSTNSDLKLLRVGRYQVKQDDITFTIWIIRYWSIVIPLTLISAYLLHSNPRISKSEIALVFD